MASTGARIMSAFATSTLLNALRPMAASSRFAASVALRRTSDLRARDALRSRSSGAGHRRPARPGSIIAFIEREAMPLAQSGFGQEVRDAIHARVDHLADQGLARRDGQRIVMQRDLLNTPCVGANSTQLVTNSRPKPACRMKAQAGEYVAGTVRQRLTLSSAAS